MKVGTFSAVVRGAGCAEGAAGVSFLRTGALGTSFSTVTALTSII